MKKIIESFKVKKIVDSMSSLKKKEKVYVYIVNDDNTLEKANGRFDIAFRGNTNLVLHKDQKFVIVTKEKSNSFNEVIVFKMIEPNRFYSDSESNAKIQYKENIHCDSRGIYAY